MSVYVHFGVMEYVTSIARLLSWPFAWHTEDLGSSVADESNSAQAADTTELSIPSSYVLCVTPRQFDSVYINPSLQAPAFR